MPQDHTSADKGPSAALTEILPAAPRTASPTKPRSADRVRARLASWRAARTSKRPRPARAAPVKARAAAR
jgi:hypothetical protein